MKQIIYLTLSLLVSGLLLCSILAQEEAGEDKTIIAKGVSAHKDPAVARDEAILDALRKAVEQGIGTFISSQTEVQDYVAVYDKIVSESRGYIKKYEVISEGTEGNRTFVEIEAVVSLSRLKGDWDDLKMQLKRKGNPKVLIIMTEKIDGNIEEKSDFGTREIENFFKEKGNVNLVDRTTLEEAKMREIQKATNSGDMNQVAHIGGQAGANIIIIGTVEATGSGKIANSNYFAYKGNAGAKAVRADDAKILCSLSVETSKALTDPAKRTAAIKAIKDVSTRLAPSILDGIMKEWSADLTSGSQITLTVKNVGFPEWTKIKKALTSIRGVTDIVLDSMSNNIATIRLKVPMSTEKFAERLIKIKEIDLSEITELTENTIGLTYKEKSDK
ncbi:MAG: hypothetical protein ABIH42_00685 [Planctomycetota bacterium]